MIARLAPGLAAVIVAITAAGCTGGGSPAAQLRSWQSGASYGSSQQLFVSDVHEIANGLSRGPLVAVKTACDGLGVDAANAYGELPTPDHALTEDLNGEYLDYTNAAQSCSTAPALRSSAVTRYRLLVAKAADELARAKRRIAAIEAS